MRVFLSKTAIVAVSLVLALSAYGQQPPDRGGDRPPRPADAPQPRGAPRVDDDRPPPPGKAGPRPRAELPDQPGPPLGRGGPGSPNNFQPPGRARGGGGFSGEMGGF